MPDYEKTVLRPVQRLVPIMLSQEIVRQNAETRFSGPPWKRAKRRFDFCLPYGILVP